MKQFLLMCVATTVFSLPLLEAQDKQDEGFPLSIHIVCVELSSQPAHEIDSTQPDCNSDKPMSAFRGGFYPNRVYTVHVDGSNVEYKMTSPVATYKGGKGLAVGTLSVSAMATSHQNYWLLKGDYKARWNDDGSLEIQFNGKKGRLTHQTFFVRSQATMKSAPPTTKQPSNQ